MSTFSSVMTAVIVFMFFLYVCVRLGESEIASRHLRDLFGKFAKRPLVEKLFILVFVVMMVAHGGSKTNSVPQGGGGNAVVVIDSGTVADGGVSGTLISGDIGGAALLTGPESPRLTSNQYAAGFALLTRTLTNSAWLAVPSNAVAHAPWGRYGLAEDTFWLPATNWAFVLGTNAAAGAHVSSTGTLSFDPDTPKGSPRAAAMPDGDTLSFLAPLQGSLGTVPPQGRFWHAVTTNGSVLMTWQDLYAGRDTNSPVTFQAELFGNGDFAYRYAFTNAVALTNFAVGAQHNGGGETYALNDTNRLANGLELRWRAFGALDPGIDDHDGDGLSTYDEVMTYGTDPAMPDTDLDGLGDAAETAAGLNPLARDSDGDGIPDGSDPHPLDPSGDTADADGDGLPDSWESRWFGSTNATDSADADTNGDGFSDRANLLAGANPAFAACVVTASGGAHTFTWTVLPDATNYAAIVTRGGAAVWSCMTNVGLLSVTGDYSSAVHTLTVTSYGSVTSRTASVTFRQPSQPNLTVWKIADPFALELPQGCTNVLERSFRINRSAAWQQYFVSSGHDSAGAWSLDGLRLDWSDSGGGSGSAAASPAGDSLRLAVSTNGPQSLTVRIVPDGASGLVRSPKPLYLLGWSPAVAFSSSGTVSVASTNGNVLVAVSDRSGGATAVSFTVDRGGRPGAAAPGADETAQQSDPFGPGSGASFSGTYDSGGNLTGGTVTAGDPGGFPLPNPAGGGGGGGGCSSQPPPPPPPPDAPPPPSTLCLISPAVCHSVGIRHCGCDYYGTDSYPFDSACIREAWRNSGGCSEEEPAGFSVTLGSEALDARFTVSINGAACSFHAWEDDESTAHASVALDGTDVWGADVERESRGPGGICGYIWGGGECGSCGGCENGDCASAEGESLGSVRFRIPLGFTGQKQMAGFVWFHLETPETITPATFTVTGDASVQTEHANAGGALSRAYSALPGGRDVRFVSVGGGVRVSVRDTGDAAEDRAWLITSDAGSVTFLKTDSAANTELNVTYTQLWPGYWVRTDNATGLTKTRYVSGSVSNGVEFTEDIVRDAASLILSGRRSSRTLVGAGPAAVEREIRLDEWDGAAQVWRETDMTWWTDSLNPLLNGRPKFRYGDGGDWEYRAHDARGRETLRAEPLDGSSQPFFKDDAQPFAFSPAASYGSLTGLITVTSYAPAPGDGGALNDSRKPREVSVYAMRGGLPSLISREWRVYARATNDVWQTVTQRVIRAAFPAAGPDDAANARSLTVAYADDDDAVPALLRGRSLREERGDGTLLTWEYALDAATLTITSKRGTAAHPDGLANVSTYEVETFDAVFGRALGRETRLYTGAAGGVLLASETMTYDAQGRLLATAYSDGTAESNVWGCCRLDSKIGRDGMRTEYWAIPGNESWSATAETSLGGLPGLNGCHPVTEIFADALGRMTNTVASVWSNGAPSSAHARMSTATEYPYGTSDYTVTTDPFGTPTVHFVTQTGSARITATRSPGVTNTVTQYFGGSTVYTSCTTNGVATTTYATTYATNGCRVDTVSVVTNGVAVTNIVTEYDFLGNPAGTVDPAIAVPVSSVSYQQISNIWYRTCVGSIVTNGITNTLFTAVRQLTGLMPSVQQQVTATNTNSETIGITVLVDAATAMRTVTRQNLTLNTTETTAYLDDYPVFSVDAADNTNAFLYTYNASNEISLQSQQQEGARGVETLSLFPSPDETDAMIRSHFESLRIKLARELTALCPQNSAKLDGKRACCNPVDCKIDAQLMAYRYIAALEAAWRAREVPFGGFTGNVLIDLTGGNGLNYPEDIVPGLVCDGWRGMADTVLSPATSGSSCWNFENGQRNGLITLFSGEPAHVWAILKSVNGSASLDPWPSGGWEY